MPAILVSDPSPHYQVPQGHIDDNDVTKVVEINPFNPHEKPENYSMCLEKMVGPLWDQDAGGAPGPQQVSKNPGVPG